MDAYLTCICGKTSDQHAGADHPFLEKRPDYDPSTWLRAAFPYPTKAGPPSAVYIQLEDRLQITCNRGPAGGTTIPITARILRPDGLIIALNLLASSGGSFVPTSTQFDLVEGYLLSIATSPDGAALQRGHIFVTAELIRGSGANAFVTQVLFADYVTNSYFLGFPGGRINTNIEGFGSAESITVAAPAAGVELSVSVPSRGKWRLRSIVFSLTTGATVANREVNLVIDDSVTILTQIPSNFTQAASLTEKYVFALGTQSVKGSVTLIAVSPIPDMLLFNFYRIRTLTTALQATDQYTSAQLAVEQWVE